MISNDWSELNKHYLNMHLSRVYALVQAHIDRVNEAEATAVETIRDHFKDSLHEHKYTDSPCNANEFDFEQFSADMPFPPALDAICEIFDLSAFERDVLLLCAGLELDSKFARIFHSLTGSSDNPEPTFSLALAIVPDAHWSALTAESALRRWRLIELAPGAALTMRPLQIDERILHYLTGIDAMDTRLRGLISPVEQLIDLAGSQQRLADRITELWFSVDESYDQPCIQLCESNTENRQMILSAACHLLGIQLWAIRAADIPANSSERTFFIDLWQREAALTQSALLIECDTFDHDEIKQRISVFAGSFNGLLMISSPVLLTISHRQHIRLTVPQTGIEEQQQILWRQALGHYSDKLNGSIDRIVNQFRLHAQDIQVISDEMLLYSEDTDGQTFDRMLWDACRKQARTRLNHLAQRIESKAAWEDLVLPDVQYTLLRQIGNHVRQRIKVYDHWGFAEKSSRGLGISALFAGSSGTGKTLAAEVLANELELDLYRIDLSQVISKYIGETEKNLQRVFVAAEHNGAILLFDEADALFGKRSEVKDSHDRYANIEVSYLLQQMEAYRGLAILTTNRKNDLDSAFLRRIRFVVEFPFPTSEYRAAIWRRMFPAQAPVAELDFGRLAQLNISGGNIHNIALNAAFLAADEETAINPKTLLKAAQFEYAKLEKTLTNKETAGWI